MTWTDFEHVKREEFIHPEHLDINVAQAAQETRRWLGRPMLFSKVDGVVRHPNGDAVPPDSDSHSVFSLHRYGISHTASRRAGRRISSPSIGGMAIDWDCPSIPLLDLYFAVERLNVWTGIGLYPYWNNPGLHTDLRDRRHPDYGARWYQDQDGSYKPLTVQALSDLLHRDGK